MRTITRNKFYIRTNMLREISTLRKPYLIIVLGLYFAIAIISYYFYVASSLAENFSFSKDQLWSIPEAISLILNTSLNKNNEIVLFNQHIPIATGPYGGAYKTYLYSLTFSLLDLPSEKIIILTNQALVFIFLVALIGNIKVKKISNLLPILLVPFLDLHFLFASILDAGPILIEIIFLTLVLRFLSNIFAGSPSETDVKKYLLISLCFCGFAINDKLTILPNLVAPFIPLLLVKGRKVLKIIPSIKFLSCACLVILISTQPFLFYIIREGTEPMFSMVGSSYSIKTSFYQRASELWTNFFELSNSSYLFDVMSGDTPKSNLSYTKTLAVISVAGLISIAYLRIKNKTGDHTLFIYLSSTFLLSFLLQASVQGLNRPWHLFQLYPPLILLACESIRHLNKSKLFRSIFYAGTLVLVAIQFQNVASTIERVRKTVGINEFSNNLKECASKLVSNKITDLYILNYSVGEPLFVYSKGTVKYHDLYWADKGHILDQLKNNYNIQRIAYRTPVETKSTFGTQLEFLRGPLTDNEKLMYFTEEISCKDEAGSILTIAKRNS